MNKKIKINLRNFGEIYYSNNVELEGDDYVYSFHKKGTKILHNEYGPAWSNAYCYKYYINNKEHRLSGPAYYFDGKNYKYYSVLGKKIGYERLCFIKNIANILIPKK